MLGINDLDMEGLDGLDMLGFFFVYARNQRFGNGLDKGGLRLLWPVSAIWKWEDLDM